MRSGHSFTRKVVLMVETVYNIINLVFSWFSIVGLFKRVNDKFLTISLFKGNFYLFFVNSYFSNYGRSCTDSEKMLKDCTHFVTGGSFIWFERHPVLQ